MWAWTGKARRAAKPAEAAPSTLKDAVRQARIETAERSGVVVDLRDAEAARLELLNDALDPVFADIPEQVELFDRGVSRGDVPRLWIDIVAYVVMGRDKRLYRFVQDTRFGRKVLSETADIAEMSKAITRYIAGRLVERERALANSPFVSSAGERRPSRGIAAFLLGVAAGIGALVIAALWQAVR